MSKGNTFENELLKLLFNNDNIPNVGDATGLRGASTAGVFYIALHTADPGEAGDQTTSEATYGAYARVSVARTSSGWSISGNVASPVAPIDFPKCTSGTNTISYGSIGVAASGASKILYSGPLSNNIAVALNVIPRLGTGSTISED